MEEEQTEVTDEVTYEIDMDANVTRFFAYEIRNGRRRVYL
jgi:hypothetical protein